jgi:hypothetical protein
MFAALKLLTLGLRPVVLERGKDVHARKFDMARLSREGVVDPDLRDKSLQEHFEVGDAKALCDKLFGFEINDLSDAISALSGIRADNDEDEEEEIKN